MGDISDINKLSDVCGIPDMHKLTDRDFSYETKTIAAQVTLVAEESKADIASKSITARRMGRTLSKMRL